MQRIEVITGLYQEPKRIVNEKPFPEDAQERQGALLAGLSTAPKIALFLLTPSHTGITERELNSLYYGISKGTPMEDRYAISNTKGLRTLVDNGLLYEYFDQNHKRQISKTKAGIAYGIPAAQLMLNFESNTQISIREVLGKTSGTNSRINTQLMRAQILSYLQDKDHSLRRDDIAAALNADPGRVGSVLQTLAEIGAVNYIFAPKTGVSITQFEANPKFEGNPEAFVNSSGQQQILDICINLIGLNLPITADGVKSGLSADFISGWNSERALRNYILKILSNLTKQGFLKRTLFEGNQKFSDARITEMGSLVATGFLNPLAEIAEKNPDDINASPETIPEVDKSTNRKLRRCFKLYYPHSSSFMDKVEDENYRNVISVLSLSQGGLSLADIAKKLGLNKDTIYGYIKNLRFAYPLKIEKHGKVLFFSLKSELLQNDASQEKRIIAGLRSIARLPIPNFDKRKLMIYSVWMEVGSISRAAVRTGLTEPQIWQIIEDVNKSQKLVQLFSETDIDAR